MNMLLVLSIFVIFVIFLYANSNNAKEKCLNNKPQISPMNTTSAEQEHYTNISSINQQSKLTSISYSLNDKENIKTNKKYWINDSCIACGACGAICNEVFSVDDRIAKINEENIAANIDLIEEAIEACPVEAIEVSPKEQNSSTKSNTNTDKDYTKKDNNLNSNEPDLHDADYYVKRAEIHYKNNEYNEAITDYSKAIELNPTKASYYKERADVYFLKKEEYDKAISDYNKAIEIDPKDYDAYCNRATVYFLRNEYDQAIADYSKVIEFNPKNPFYYECYKSRASIYFLKEEYNQAIADYSKAIELDPKFVVNYAERAEAYVAIKEYDKAITDYSKSIELTPELDCIFYYEQRAELYIEIKEYEKAISDYNKLIEINPKNYDAYCNRASVWIALGRIEEAKIDLRKAKKYVNDTEAEAEIQRALDSLKNVKLKTSSTSTKNTETKSNTKKTISRNKKQVTVIVQNPGEKENNIKAEKYIENANSYENRKDYINAINEYTKAIELNPDNIAEIYVYRAQCCMEFGQYNNVVEDCTKAIEKTKMYNSTAYYTRGLAYQKLNEKEKAKEDFKQALSIKPDDVTYKKAYDSLLKGTSTKINLERCTKEEMLSLDGFNAEKAERFINDRDNGKMWYDIETFVQDFELQPHEMVMIQDRLKFPDKPKNKYGRKIDI